MSMAAARPLALVTGASSGIGLELARQFAQHGFDLVVCADHEAIEAAAADLRSSGGEVRAVRADLRTPAGVEELYDAVTADRRPLAAAALNAGIGRGGGSFVDTDLSDHLDVIRLNVVGTVHLAKLILNDMVDRDTGRMLITSSMVAAMPGAYQVTYNGSKSFLQSFVLGLQNELHDSAVTVTALMPGITETPFFTRAQMDDALITKVPKDDPARVAQQGFDALLKGRRRVVGGSPLNRLTAAVNAILPDAAKAQLQAVLSKPSKPRRKR